MQSFVVIIVVILWFFTRIVTAFRITNQLNVDNLTETFDGTSLLESQDNQTIDEIVNGFDGINGNGNSTNDTLDFDRPSTSMVVIDSKTNDGINLNHTVLHSALVASSRDPVRGIIFRQKIKPKARSFFGLIIIPCKCNVIGNCAFVMYAIHTNFVT